MDAEVFSAKSRSFDVKIFQKSFLIAYLCTPKHYVKYPRSSITRSDEGYTTQIDNKTIFCMAIIHLGAINAMDAKMFLVKAQVN